MSEGYKSTLKKYFEGSSKSESHGKERCCNCKHINRTVSGELFVTVKQTVRCNKRSEDKALATLNLDSCCNFEFFNG